MGIEEWDFAQPPPLLSNFRFYQNGNLMWWNGNRGMGFVYPNKYFQILESNHCLLISPLVFPQVSRALWVYNALATYSELLSWWQWVPKRQSLFLIGVTEFGYFCFCSVYRWEPFLCLSGRCQRSHGLVPQCHRGHSHVSLFEFYQIWGIHVVSWVAQNISGVCMGDSMSYNKTYCLYQRSYSRRLHSLHLDAIVKSGASPLSRSPLLHAIFLCIYIYIYIYMCVCVCVCVCVY